MYKNAYMLKLRSCDKSEIQFLKRLAQMIQFLWTIIKPIFFKEVSDLNQHLFELKQCQKK